MELRQLLRPPFIFLIGEGTEINLNRRPEGYRIAENRELKDHLVYHMNNVNKAFGGETWLNGRLAFKDGVQQAITDLFKESGSTPEEEGDKYMASMKHYDECVGRFESILKELLINRTNMIV